MFQGHTNLWIKLSLKNSIQDVLRDFLSLRVWCLTYLFHTVRTNTMWKELKWVLSSSIPGNEMTLPCFFLGNLPGEHWKASLAEVIALAVKLLLTHRSDLFKIWIQGVQCMSLHSMGTNLVLLYWNPDLCTPSKFSENRVPVQKDQVLSFDEKNLIGILPLSLASIVSLSKLLSLHQFQSV